MKSDYQFIHSRKQELINLISEFFLFIYEIIVCLPLSMKLQYSLKKVKKKKLFILGNGPSLKKDLSKIENNSQIFAVNSFLSKRYLKSYRPNFLCIIDSMFWENYNRLNISVKKPVQKTFEELNKVDWGMILFIPKNAEKIFQLRIKNKKIKIIIIPSLSYDFECYFYLKIFSYLKLPPPRINVTVTAIYIGIISKIKNINLLGLDMDRIHSFKVDKITNSSYMEYVHFSKTNNKPIKFTNKFKDRKQTSMYIKLKREASTFKWYGYISMLSKKHSIVLKNKSSKSLLDSIDR
ncbi:DUF115 domain-containing protein [Candidatus Pelagibacter ubique]|jgi:hypothetical protein|nr:DUF115 domain-containing protein [Candidatus Pelagibacter ubique]